MYSSTPSLTSDLDGVNGLRHASVTLPPGKTNCIGGWVGPQTGLDWCGKSRPYGDSISGLASLYRVTIPTELSRRAI